MVRMTILLTILWQPDGLVICQLPKRGTLNGLVVGQIRVVRFSDGHTSIPVQVWQKLTVLNPLTDGQMVTIHEWVMMVTFEHATRRLLC